MRALAAGPLGVLVMVAPLVAIPLLSTFGIPQFAPLVASPGDDQGDSDIVPVAPEEPVVELEPSRPSSAAANRTADDLFAPLAPAPSRSQGLQLAERPSLRYTANDSGLSDSGLGDSGLGDSGLGDLVPPGSELRKPRRSRARSAREAMSGWDEVPETAETEAQPDFSGDAQLSMQDELEEDLPSTGRTLPSESPGRGSDLRLPGDAPPLEMLEQVDGEELTWKGAAAKLNELGIREYMVKAQADGRFKFTCGVSDPGSPQVDRWFVTYADEPLMAIEKALRQIEEWRESQ